MPSIKRQSGVATPTLLLVITMVALAGALYMLMGSMAKQKAAEERLAAQEAEVAALQTKAKEVDRLTVQTQQIAQLRKDSAELVKLRGEIAALRPAQQQVTKLTAENQQLKAQVNQLTQAAGQASALRNQNEQMKTAIMEKEAAQQKQLCVANLTQIQAAKTAWATDNNKRPIDIPLDPELFGPGAYLDPKPACPTQGVYTLGDVQSPPTCTVPGHGL